MNDEIVAIADSDKTLVFNDFWAKSMGESEEETTTYPVQVQAVMADWIFREEGKVFLNALVQTENLQMYDNEFIKVVINYLYSKL